MPNYYQKALLQIKNLLGDIKTIKPLGGVTNINFLVTTLIGKEYVLKLLHISLQHNREQELLVNIELSKLNITPKIILYSLPNYYVLKYLKGSLATKELFNNKNYLFELCSSLIFLHKMKIKHNGENLDKKIWYYLEELNNTNSNYYIKLLEFYNYIFSYAEKLPSNIGFCHNDLNLNNIIISKQKLYMLDFEYAGYNDIFFDLASLKFELNKIDYHTLCNLYYNNTLATVLSSKVFSTKLAVYELVVLLAGAIWYFYIANTNNNSFNCFNSVTNTSNVNNNNTANLAKAEQTFKQLERAINNFKNSTNKVSS